MTSQIFSNEGEQQSLNTTKPIVGVSSMTPQTIFSKDNWTEFITDEILQVFKDTFDENITVEELKKHSFDYLPFDIQNLITAEVQAREEKAKADSFKQEKKCSSCGEVLIVEEANGQKFFTCKNGSDLFHREGISKKSLEEDFAYLQEHGFHESLVKENIAKLLYKMNKAKGLKTFMELQGTYYEKRPHYVKGFFHKVLVEKNLVLEINEKVKGEGTLVEHIYNKADMEIILTADLKYWKVLKVESVGYGHVTTKSYNGYYRRNFENSCGDHVMNAKVEKEYAEDRANTESFLVTFQRMNTEFDQAILQKYIDQRRKDYEFHDAVDMIPNFNINQTVENGWYGLDVENTRNWGIARTKILGKKGLLVMSARGTSGDVSRYVDKVNLYRYVPADAKFVTQEEKDELKSLRSNREEYLKCFERIKEKYGLIGKSISITLYLEIIIKEEQVKS